MADAPLELPSESSLQLRCLLWALSKGEIRNNLYRFGETPTRFVEVKATDNTAERTRYAVILNFESVCLAEVSSIIARKHRLGSASFDELLEQAARVGTVKIAEKPRYNFIAAGMRLNLDPHCHNCAEIVIV